ncbi:hypothetical protein OH76DRAFT_1487421 [Lentinus brumalis]|uniref:Uncharacterized protein n=1 Tax=Lentinus brumalis TaxID=2498619 RepID=A0A371CUP7_9APHY|nr:hypothetical protein OH76DRAFT_1487421 [Polyporus brumalis]
MLHPTPYKIMSTLGGSTATKTVNIHGLCELILDELGIKGQLNITHDVLAGIAYIRGLLEFEVGNQAAGREAWDILDVRLRAALEGRSDVVLRMAYLQEWLARDQQVHGVIPQTAVIKAQMGELQEKIATAMQALNYVDEVPVV